MNGLPQTYWPKATWSALLVLGFVSRVIILGSSLFAPLGDEQTWIKLGHAPEVVKTLTAEQARLTTPTRMPLRCWYRWDAWWYMAVAERGYENTPGVGSTAAFMPLLPLCIRAGTIAGLDPYWVGLIVPNLAFVVGLVAFGRVVAMLTGDDGTAWRACLLLITFPTAFFFAAPYTESLGFATTVWGIWAWMDRRPVTAAFSLALSTAARLACVSTSLAIIAEWCSDVVHRRQPRPWAWPVALLGLGGLLCFFGYMGYALGDPLIHLKAHQPWGRKAGLQGMLAFVHQFVAVCRTNWVFDLALGVSTALFVGLRAAPYLPSLSQTQRHRYSSIALLLLIGATSGFALWGVRQGIRPIEIVRLFSTDLYSAHNNLSFFVFFILSLSIWVRRGPFWGVLTLVPIAMAATSGTPTSMARIVLMCVPAFIELADLCRNRWFFALVIFTSTIVQAVMFTRFTRLFYVF